MNFDVCSFYSVLATPMITDMWSSYIVSDLYVQICCLSTIVQQMSDLYGLSPL